MTSRLLLLLLLVLLGVLMQSCQALVCYDCKDCDHPTDKVCTAAAGGICAIIRDGQRASATISLGGIVSLWRKRFRLQL